MKSLLMYFPYVTAYVSYNVSGDFMSALKDIISEAFPVRSVAWKWFDYRRLRSYGYKLKIISMDK
jgi:hypothetical protein